MSSLREFWDGLRPHEKTALAVMAVILVGVAFFAAGTIVGGAVADITG
jgi:hypothetical protein